MADNLKISKNNYNFIENIMKNEEIDLNERNKFYEEFAKQYMKSENFRYSNYRKYLIFRHDGKWLGCFEEKQKPLFCFYVGDDEDIYNIGITEKHLEENKCGCLKNYIKKLDFTSHEHFTRQSICNIVTCNECNSIDIVFENVIKNKNLKLVRCYLDNYKFMEKSTFFINGLVFSENSLFKKLLNNNFDNYLIERNISKGHHCENNDTFVELSTDISNLLKYKFDPETFGIFMISNYENQIKNNKLHIDFEICDSFFDIVNFNFCIEVFNNLPKYPIKIHISDGFYGI